MTAPEELAEQARIMVDAGAECVYVVDSAGALVLAEAQARIEALVDEVGDEAAGRLPRPPEPVARRRQLVLAVQAGARQIDGSLCALGAGAGNSPTEVLAATFDQLGVETGVDVGGVLDAAEEVVAPFLPRCRSTDRTAIVQGYAGVYSSFLLHAERAAERFGVPAHEILQRARRGRLRRRPGGHDHRHRAAALAGAGPQRGRRQVGKDHSHDRHVLRPRHRRRGGALGRRCDVRRLEPLDPGGLRAGRGGRPEDAARAVASSRQAFDEGPWPRLGRVERAAAMHRLADVMEAHADELATLDTTNMGKPFAQAKHDVGRSVANFRFFADHQRDHTGETYPMDSGHHTYSEYGPVGVVAAISPWNFPLMMASWKVAPAIAWGNTCVVKPSEDTPASVTMLGRLAVEAGFPPGVINVLNGHGTPAGSSLTADDRVDRVTFTGSSATGKVVMASAAGHLAPVSLELGGKGANVVFEDADLDNAVHWTVEAIFRNSGQVCLAGSRLFVASAIYDEFMERFVAAAEALTVGDPFDPATKFASLASKRHFDKVTSYVDGVGRRRRHRR